MACRAARKIHWGHVRSICSRINADTLYRIHGTIEPELIGKAASSGCIRMLNEDIVSLYDRVEVGTPVIVRSAG